MSSNCYSAIVRQCKSSRIQHVISALCQIKSVYSTNSKDVEKLVAHGLVPTLLELLRTATGLDDKHKVKVIDLSISILGNMCMEGCTRNQVLKLKGLPELAELFLSDHNEALLHRTCRCLANMLQSPEAWKLAESSAVNEKLIQLLQKTEKDGYRPTYIRTIRLLGQTGPYVQRLLDKNAVSILGKLIDSDNPDVKQSTVRCLHSLATHGCSEQFAGQFVSTGKLGALLTLAATDNFDAFHLVVLLSNYQNFRPEFGNSEGIATFTNLFSDEETSHWKKNDILSVLCLCSKDAVNRVKLREHNSLPLLLNSLQAVFLSAVHERVISSLLCYIYDDAGFEVLLTNGLVKVLVCYLKKHCNLKADFDIENDPTFSDRNVKISLEEDLNYLNAKSGQQVDGTGSSCAANKPELNQDATKGNQKAQVKEDEHSSASKPYFHIDSPTYKNGTNANDDDSDEIRCIQRFSPPHTGECVNKASYSPLSNVSYYSPGESSPEYTTFSPASSPESTHGTGLKRNGSSATSCHGYTLLSGSQIPDHVHPKYPKYTGIRCNLYKKETGLTSDCMERSRVLDSDIDSDGADVSDTCCTTEDGESNADFSPVFSPSCPTEEEENIDDNVNHAASSRISTETNELDVETLQEANADENKDNVDGSGKGFLNRKPAEKRKKITNTSHAVENHILSLLSRVSQMNDPTSYLVTMETMSGLLDYLLQMERPLARCARLLSRVFRNRLCFHDLLALGVPLMVYEKLLSQENIRELVKDLRKPRPGNRSSISSSICHDDLDSDRFSTASNVSSPEEQPRKRHKSSIEDGTAPGKYKDTYRMRTQDVCSAGVSGMALLEDLAWTAQSQYGKGVVDRLLCTKPSPESQLQIATNILYITWTLDSRQHYFDHLAILDSLVGALKPGSPTETYMQHSIVCGLHFQMTMLKTSERLNRDSTFSPHRQGVLEKEEPTTVDELACNRDISISDDDRVTFVTNGRQIHASRKTLVSKSEIFVAMLEGHYSEARISSIPLAETSFFAFSCVLCYLHGCEFDKCPTLRKMKTETVTKASVEDVIEVYNEAEKHMLTELKSQSYAWLVGRYVLPQAAVPLLEFGVLHQKHEVIKATVSAIFTECNSRELLICQVDELLQSKYVDLISNTIFELLTE